jgi:hypothetical protein
MSNTQPRYYVLKPVSEKPEKDGAYPAISSINYQAVGLVLFKDGRLQSIPRTPIAGYLSPVTKDALRKCTCANSVQYEDCDGKCERTVVEQNEELIIEVERLKGLLQKSYGAGYSDFGNIGRLEGFNKFQQQHNL